MALICDILIHKHQKRHSINESTSFQTVTQCRTYISVIYVFTFLPGFKDKVVPELQKNKLASSLCLMLLTSSVATGAAFLAAHVALGRSYPRKLDQKQLAIFHA